MADRNTKKVHARYKNDYNKQARFEPRFAKGDYLFVERPFY